MTFFTNALTASEAPPDGYGSVFVSAAWLLDGSLPHTLSLTMTAVVAHFTVAVAVQS